MANKHTTDPTTLNTILCIMQRQQNEMEEQLREKELSLRRHSKVMESIRRKQQYINPTGVENDKQLRDWYRRQVGREEMKGLWWPKKK